MGATNGNYKWEIPNACALGGAVQKPAGVTNVKSKALGSISTPHLNKNFEFWWSWKIDVDDKWANYFPAMGMLAKMESSLKLWLNRLIRE